MTVQIKQKNTGNVIIKPHSKFNPNSKCISKENSLNAKKPPPSKYKPNSEHTMHVNNSKNNNSKISMKKTYAISLIRPPSFKKYSEASSSVNTSTTSTNANKNFVPCKEKTYNSSNPWTNSAKPNQCRQSSIRKSFQKHSLQHWQKTCTT